MFHCFGEAATSQKFKVLIKKEFSENIPLDFFDHWLYNHKPYTTFYLGGTAR